MDLIEPEHHPFEAFVPVGINVLILGTFPGKQQTGNSRYPDAWYYGAPRNQFWRIMALVYDRELQTREQKEALLTSAGIGIADIFQTVIRTAGSNLDENLQVQRYNWETVSDILRRYQPAVFGTSRLVESLFRKQFPAYPQVGVLPSPSPRYFALTISQKAAIYRQKLPPLPSGDRQKG